MVRNGVIRQRTISPAYRIRNIPLSAKNEGPKRGQTSRERIGIVPRYAFQQLFSLGKLTTNSMNPTVHQTQAWTAFKQIKGKLPAPTQ